MNRVTRRFSALLRLAAVATVGCWPAIACGEGAIAQLDFNRDIRPILSDTCFACHGPDQNKRVSPLRLDLRDSVFADLDGSRAVVPGEPDDSELLRRITSDDPDLRMPPPDSGRVLTEAQIALFEDWIRAGAPWQEHWSFVPPERPHLPGIKEQSWPRNEIDHFVLARLESHQLRPSTEAAKTSLIRRVSLDLTGLPPTLDEVDEYLSDNAPESYERVVDRLLQSPRYGERMALMWLDAARYADTSGYQTDGPRYMWRWRDWVIAAFNHNMPFDQFTIHQLAGDLIDPPLSEPEHVAHDYKSAWRGNLIRDPIRLDHLIASAFHRNHRGNAEGGIIPEEYQVEYVVDRVDTTFTIWLGLTMGCCKCHDHKYDPISQQEFYETFAYFNNIPEHGRALKEGNSAPFIKAPTSAQLSELDRIDAVLAAARSQMEELEEPLASALASWEDAADLTDADEWTLADGMIARYRFDGNLADQVELDRHARFDRPGGAFVTGPLDQAVGLDGTCLIEVGDYARFGYFDKFSLTAWIRPAAATGTVLSRMVQDYQGKGYYVRLADGKLEVNLVARWLDDALRLETVRPIPLDQWSHIAITYDGSRETEGVGIYVNGRREPLKVNADFINQTFAGPELILRVGGGSESFVGAIDDVRIYDRDLDAEEVACIATSATIAEIVATPVGERADPWQAKLRRYYIEQQAPENIREAYSRLEVLRRQRREFLDELPTLMVMQELATPRETHLLLRGRYDDPGHQVAPGVPSVLPPLPDGAPRNRLGFARWLVGAADTLTARVIMNRFWQMYFGTGLVKTTEDFGAQGEPPSHPQLLDWLGVEFVHSGWNMKAMQKLIVMSATYRQSSQSSAESRTVDPENRLLAHGPRFRLPAEMIRDQALAVSGLLTGQVGGPSVLPYQPDDLWKDIASIADYNQSHGADLYRRSLYTFWKRTIAPPTMVTLDATPRDMCTVKRSRTNTPLQALTLMNEIAFVEAARVLAQRAMVEGGDTTDGRLRYAFRAATAREPDAQEMQVIRDGWNHHLESLRNDAESAQQLISTGEHPVDDALDPAELATYTIVASMILNLDELITKE